MFGEYDYYATYSGLTPKQNFSLADHKYAYFANASGLTPKEQFSLADHMLAFYKAAVPETGKFTIAGLEYDYFLDVTNYVGSVALSINDLKTLFFSTFSLTSIVRVLRAELTVP